jgi:Zn-dependent M16 (insulinase) family peptidase
MDISAHCWAGARRGEAEGPWLFVTGKALPNLANALLDGIRGAFLQDIPEPVSITRLISSGVAGVISGAGAMGHLYCETRLRAQGSYAGAWNERLNGLGRKAALDSLSARDPEEVFHSLKRLRDQIFATSRFHLAISGIEPITANVFATELGRMTCQVTESPLVFQDTCEGIPVNAANFTTGQALQLTDPGAAHVAAHMLETGWLWDSVRVAGGAYSVRCRYETGDSILTILSIRDPEPLRTLDCFRASPVWLARNAHGDLLERCVVAKMGHLIRAVRPDDRMMIALQRHLSGETDELRQQELEGVGQVNARSMKHLVQELDADFQVAKTVVLGPEDGLACALAERPGFIILQSE